MALLFEENKALQSYHTFGIKAFSRYFCTLDTLDDLPALLQHPLYCQGSVLWLGGGSNIVFTQDYPGLVIQVRLNGIRQLSQTPESVIIEAAAGENWHRFVSDMLQKNYYGLENLSLIPGTVGAAPVQNIGAYGVEVKDSITEVVCADLYQQGKTVIFSKAQCQFAYRDSVFKNQAPGRYLITAVRFVLSTRPTVTIEYGQIKATLAQMGVHNPLPQEVGAAICQIRSSKLPDPAILGNAGSFFKNPLVDHTTLASLLMAYPNLPHYSADDGKVKLAAGWLIEQAGLKGFHIGKAAVHEKQALVLVNEEAQATGPQIQALARYIQEKIHMQFGVRLEIEPLML